MSVYGTDGERRVVIAGEGYAAGWAAYRTLNETDELVETLVTNHVPSKVTRDVLGARVLGTRREGVNVVGEKAVGYTYVLVTFTRASGNPAHYPAGARGIGYRQGGGYETSN